MSPRAVTARPHDQSISRSDGNARFPLDLAAFAIAPLTILAQGHRFGLGNHDTLLSFIRRVNNPFYLSADWMLNTPPVHPQLVSLMAMLTSMFGEPGAFLLVHMITRILLLMGVWRLAAALLPARPQVAFLAMVATVLEPRFQLGGHYLQGGHWEPNFLGMALATWMVAEGIRLVADRGGDWIRMALIGGAGIFAHMFLVLPLFGVTMLTWLVVSRDWRRVALATTCALVLASPVLLPAARGFLFPEDQRLTAEQVIAVLQYRHPHHHQPWTWPLWHWLQAAVFAAAAVYTWGRLAERRVLLLPAVLLGWFLLSTALFTLCGWFRIVPAVAYFQFFRPLSLFLLLGQIALLGSGEGRGMKEEGRGMREEGRGDFAFPLGQWVLPLAGLVALRFVDLGGALVASAVLVYTSLGARLPDVLLLRVGRRLLAALAVAGFAGVLWLQVDPALRSLLKMGRAEYWLVEALPQDSARYELMRWVQLETRPTELFAIPPNMGNFRIWEQRAIVVDSKNVPYENLRLGQWAERMADATGDDPFAPRARLSPRDPEPERLIRLAGMYQARYVVIREAIDHPFTVFRNQRYTVLDVQRVDGQLPMVLVPAVPGAPD